MSSSRHTHWCYRCRTTVRLRGDHIICSNCAGGFVQDLNEMDDVNPSEFFGLDSSHDQDQRFEMMEALTGLVRRRLMRRNQGLSVRGLSELVPEDGDAESESGGSSPWLIFRGQIPVRMSENGSVEVLLDGNASDAERQANVRNLSVGQELDELIEQLTMNDEEGPAAASKSSINAMPTIEICQEHINKDPHCSICIERFELGSAVRRMPCNHIYHSDCIVRWLVRRNSCPICRRQLPREEEPSNAHSSQSSIRGVRGIRVMSTSSGSRNSRASINRSGSHSNLAGITATGAHSSRASPNTSGIRASPNTSGIRASFHNNGIRSSHTSLDTRGPYTNYPRTSASNISGIESSFESQEQGRRNGFSGSWQSPAVTEENHEMNSSGWPFDY